MADCGAAILFRFLLAASIKELSTHRLRFCSEIRQTRAGRERGGTELVSQILHQNNDNDVDILDGRETPGTGSDGDEGI